MTRGEWLEQAIRETREWIGMVDRDADAELEHSRFGSDDYDHEVALQHHAEVARTTLEALEEEKRRAAVIYEIGPNPLS